MKRLTSSIAVVAALCLMNGVALAKPYLEQGQVRATTYDLNVTYVPADFWKDPDKIDAILRQAAVDYARAHSAVVSLVAGTETYVSADFWKDPDKIEPILRQAAVFYAQAHSAVVVEVVGAETYVPADFWKDPGKIDAILKQAAVAYAQAHSAAVSEVAGTETYVSADFWKDPDKIESILKQAAMVYAQAHPPVVAEASANETYVPADFWKDPDKIESILKQAAVVYTQANASSASRASIETTLATGTWRLINYELVTASGTQMHPYGDTAVGFMLVSPEHYAAVAIAPMDEKVKAAETYIGYMGKLDVQSDNNLHLFVNLNPNWVSRNQIKSWEFKNGQLILSGQATSVNGVDGSMTTVWELVK